MEYQCKQCGSIIILSPDKELDKKCNCNAPIIAHISATVKGHGGIK